MEDHQESEWTSQQSVAVAAVRETFDEIEFGHEHKDKPLSVQAIYVCVALLRRSAVWGIISIIVTSLERYGKTM